MSRPRTTACRRCGSDVFWAHVPGTSAKLFDPDPVDSTHPDAHVVFADGKRWLARRLAPYVEQVAAARGWSTRQAMADVIDRRSICVPHTCRHARVLTTHGAIAAEAADA